MFDHHRGTRLLEHGWLLLEIHTWLCKGGQPTDELLEGNPHKGTAIHWTPKCESTMQRLKQALTSTNLLIHPMPWHLFVVNTDASGNCIGAILQQSKDALGLAKGIDKKAESKHNQFVFKEKDLRPIAFKS